MESAEDIEIFYFLLAGTFAMFLLSSGIVVFMILYQRKLYQHNLMLQSMETRYQMKLVQSNMKEVEDERIRISKDLHDEIGSIFSALSIKLDQLYLTIGVPTPETRQVIMESKQAIEYGINSTRRISHHMIPPALEMFGLVVALEDLCSKFDTHGTGVQVHLTAEETIQVLQPEFELIIYRIVQELLQNTVKHANAANIHIALYKEHARLVLHYMDDGKGFSYREGGNSDGMGLLNIKNRVQILDAEMDFKSQPGKGIDVMIKIPN